MPDNLFSLFFNYLYFSGFQILITTICYCLFDITLYSCRKGGKIVMRYSALDDSALIEELSDFAEIGEISRSLPQNYLSAFNNTSADELRIFGRVI